MSEKFEGHWNISVILRTEITNEEMKVNMVIKEIEEQKDDDIKIRRRNDDELGFVCIYLHKVGYVW